MIKYRIPGPINAIYPIVAIECEEIGESIILNGSKNRIPKIGLEWRYFDTLEQAIKEYLADLKQRKHGAELALSEAVKMYAEVERMKNDKD